MKPFKELRQTLMEQLAEAGELSDEEILEKIDELLIGNNNIGYIPLNHKVQLRQELFDSIRKLDVLQELIDNPEVTEIMVNGYQTIFVEVEGRIKKWNKQFTSQEKLDDVIQQIAGRCNRVVNENKPIVDARLENGARVNIVISPAALNGPIITIRRFPDVPITMERLIELGSITKEAAKFLEDLVAARYSIFIGGGTSAGKTTFLNALSNYIPKNERIITIEDNAELQIQGVDNLVKLEAKEANMEGNREISIRELIKTALRMRPSRIIIGEVRSEEAIDLLQAWNTGHEGSLGTAHANSSWDMISRLETMVLTGMALPLEAIRRQIASGIDIMVHLGQTDNGKRRVLEIVEVTGFTNGEVTVNPLFRWDYQQKKLCAVNKLINTQKLTRG
jgi:Flp pilus assembly protein, ATPase CpaF